MSTSISIRDINRTPTGRTTTICANVYVNDVLVAEYIDAGYGKEPTVLYIDRESLENEIANANIKARMISGQDAFLPVDYSDFCEDELTTVDVIEHLVAVECFNLKSI